LIIDLVTSIINACKKGDNLYGKLILIYCYIEEKEPIIAELFRVLKPNGKLSIVKYNRIGRVLRELWKKEW